VHAQVKGGTPGVRAQPEWTADDVEGLTCNVLTMLVSGDVEVFAPHNKFVETFRSQTDDDWPAPTHLRARHVVRAARAQAEGTCGVQFDPATLLWLVHARGARDINTTSGAGCGAQAPRDCATTWSPP